MWKQIGKLILKVLFLMSPYILYVICWLCFPMNFFDGHYTEYIQNEEWEENNKEYCRVLVMGDSTAKAGFLPEKLSSDTYNYALAGASPIENYYYLKDYLKNNEPPQYVIYTQLNLHFLECETFWGWSVYFRRFSKDNFIDLKKNLEKYNEYSLFDASNLKDMEKEFLTYYIFYPAKYNSALKSGCVSQERYEENRAKYDSLVVNKGQTQYGTLSYCDTINISAQHIGFEVHEIIDEYFCKIIELCQANGIKFIFQNPPFNQSTYEHLQDNFIFEYTAYLKELEKQYPYASIDTELFYYGNQYFGDSGHLNKRGTDKFSEEMREKYGYVFDK